MIALMRNIFGLCNHNYKLVDKHNVLKQSDSTLTSIDNKGKYITHVVYVLKCQMCSKLNHYNVHLVK